MSDFVWGFLKCAYNIHQVKKHQSLLFECEGNMAFFLFLKTVY